jgi:hypothetical protein
VYEENCTFVTCMSYSKKMFSFRQVCPTHHPHSCEVSRPPPQHCSVNPRPPSLPPLSLPTLRTTVAWFTAMSERASSSFTTSMWPFLQAMNSGVYPYCAPPPSSAPHESIVRESGCQHPYPTSHPYRHPPTHSLPHRHSVTSIAPHTTLTETVR